jgi:osmotically-inducible protein OsmY
MMRILLSAMLLGAVVGGLGGCAATPLAMGGAAAAGGVIANDQRTTGAFVEDEAIELKAAHRIRAEIGEEVNASVTSLNRIALLTGQAPTEELRARAEAIVKSVQNVRRVYNEMEIGGPSSLSTRASDTLLTTRVKVALLRSQEEGFDALDVKVVTEKGVVYLLGIVDKQSAAIAVDRARKVPGVLKVVKVFEMREDG